MALRIKSNVDLKELEKFGMKYNGGSECWCMEYTYCVFTIYDTNREIQLNLLETGFSSLWKEYDKLNNQALGILFDLIKADLVEKVED